MKRRERGFVLAAVAVALVLLSGLLAGAFFAALQEERMGRSAQASLRALAAAEAGAAAVLAGWSASREGAVPPGGSLLVAPGLAQGSGSASVGVHAWGERVMLIRARGVDPTGSASRDVTFLVRLRLPPLETPAALVAATPLAPAIAARVSGSDHIPAGWTCGEPPRDAPLGALAPWGAPWSDWDSLAARAAPGTGLPGGARAAVLVPGDLDVIGGSGIGILLVDGDATFAGGATLTGVLLVRGRLEFRGLGGQVIGAARAGSVVADPAALAGAPVVKWSSCAVLRALRSVGVPEGVSGWAWGDVSGGW